VVVVVGSVRQLRQQDQAAGLEAALDGPMVGMLEVQEYLGREMLGVDQSLPMAVLTGPVGAEVREPKD
jgi:hypothetical protein